MERNITSRKGHCKNKKLAGSPSCPIIRKNSSAPAPASASVRHPTKKRTMRGRDVDLARTRMHKVSDNAAATRPSHIAAHPMAAVNIDAGISSNAATSSLFAPQTQGWMPMPMLSRSPPQIHEAVPSHPPPQMHEAVPCHPPSQAQGIMQCHPPQTQGVMQCHSPPPTQGVVQSHPPPQIHEAVPCHAPSQTQGVMPMLPQPPPPTQGVMPMPMPMTLPMPSNPPPQNRAATPSHFGAHPTLSSAVPTMSYTCTAAPTDDGVIREMLQQNEFLFEQMTQNIASDYLMRNIDLFIQIKENMIKITAEMKKRKMMNASAALLIEPHQINIPSIPIQSSDIFIGLQSAPSPSQPRIHTPSPSFAS